MKLEQTEEGREVEHTRWYAQRNVNNNAMHEKQTDKIREQAAERKEKESIACLIIAQSPMMQYTRSKWTKGKSEERRGKRQNICYSIIKKCGS